MTVSKAHHRQFETAVRAARPSQAETDGKRNCRRG